MLGEHESPQVRIHRYAQTCELIFEQPISFYHQQIEKQFVAEIDFSKYYIMITGLPRQVYRPAFGTDAFQYSQQFKYVEIEVVRKLEKLGVRCLSTMLLYDHTKRFCMIFNKPDNISRIEVARIAADCFNQLNTKIFDMRKTPYCNYTTVSDEILGYDKLPGAFKALDQLSRQQFFDMREMIMTHELLEEVCIPVNREQLHEDITLLRVAIRERDEQGAGMVYDALMDHLHGARDFGLLEGSMHAIRSLADGILASCGRELDEPEGFSIDHYPTFEYLRAGVRDKLMGIMASLPDGPAMSAPVLEAVRYIRHHFTEDVSLADVARHIGMSQSWLTKRFNQECSMSIPQYLMQVRMERAGKMLLETNMLVFEIANAVGFENPRYFVSVFKKAMGMTPTEYRDQMKQA